MKNNFTKLLTFIALISIFALQGVWLYNTFSILEKNLNEELDKAFSLSIENVIYQQLRNSSRIPTGKVVQGARPDNEPYINALAFHDFLESEGYPFSLNLLDSIWEQTLMKNVGFADYSICMLDSTGMILEKKKNGQKAMSGILIVKPIKTDGSKLLQTVVASPNRIIFERMALLLIASMLIAIIIGYCLYLQIKIILRQDRIAEIRSDFTHAMVHEMKNPITTILMGINSLKSGKLDKNEGLKKQYIDIVADESEHLMGLTNKILTIANFEEKNIKLTKANISIRPMFEQLIEGYRLKAVKELSMEIAYNNVEHIFADRDYIYEVFDNLIDNAVKYSKENILIQINCFDDYQHTIISIKDYGIGISLKDQKKIFDKFERAFSVRKENKVKGFGLGLNYVYQIVSAHGGSISVNSVIESFCEFIITLPNRK